MISVALIPFRFGAGAPEEISDKLREFYLSTVRMWTREDPTLDPTLPTTTLVANLQDQQTSEDTVYTALWRRIDESIRSAATIVLDIMELPENIVPPKIEMQLAAALVAALGATRAPRSPRVFLLVPKLPPREEAFRRVIQSFIDSGEIVVVADNGECIVGSNEKVELDPRSYRLARASVKKTATDLLRLKMIRRLGHFKLRKEGRHVGCVRHFFDGTRCDKELAQLFAQHIGEHWDENVPPPILYHCTVSGWIREPAFVVANTTGSKCFDIESVLAKKVDLVMDEAAPPLLLLPLIDTGRTVQDLLVRWRTAYPVVRPRLLSVLASRRWGGKTMLTVEGITYDVSFLHEVDRIHRPIGECEQCQLDLPESDFRRERHLQVPSYDMWEMSNLAGYKDEDNVPLKRDRMKMVPKYPVMFDQNGPWLARKALNLLASYVTDFPSQPMLIVCPEEEGASALVSYLRVVHDNVTIVQLPGKALKALRADNANPRELAKGWRESGEPWLAQLDEASPSQPVITMEEFTVSGGTRSAIIQFMREVGREVICHFSVVNYNPEKSPEHFPPSYSLYSFQGYPQVKLDGAAS